MRRYYSVSIASLHPQVVLARSSPLALTLEVDVLDVHVPRSPGEDGSFAIEMVVRAPDRIIDRFSRRVARQVDVIAIDVEEHETLVLGHEPALDRGAPQRWRTTPAVQPRMP